MRKVKENKKEVGKSTVFVPVEVVECTPPEVEEKSPVSFVQKTLDNNHELYNEIYGEHYQDPNCDIVARMITPSGSAFIGMNTLNEANSMMDPLLYNPMSVFATDTADHDIISVPTPFVTFGQKKAPIIESLELVKQTQPVAFQYSYAEKVKYNTERNAEQLLRAQVRHALIGFCGDICDIYRAITCSIDSEFIKRVTQFVSTNIWDVYNIIQGEINISNASSYSRDEATALAYDELVRNVIVPTILVNMYENIDRYSAEDIYYHSVSNTESIEKIFNIREQLGVNIDEEMNKFLDGKVPASARDIHTMFTAATFVTYKNLQRELEMIISAYRNALADTFSVITKDPILLEMYKGGNKIKDGGRYGRRGRRYDDDDYDDEY